MSRWLLVGNTNSGGIEDNKPLSVEVSNATGITVYKNKMQFSGGKGQLQLSNAVPGLYLLQVIDSGGNRFVIKFTVK